jgi:hypothetical protein
MRSKSLSSRFNSITWIIQIYQIETNCEENKAAKAVDGHYLIDEKFFLHDMWRQILKASNDPMQIAELFDLIIRTQTISK